MMNVHFLDVLKTGIKVIRVEYNDDYTKLDLGFLFDEDRKNSITITKDIFISDSKTRKELIECIGINLNEEIKLKSIKDFRYFSLKFAPFDSIREDLMLAQFNKAFEFTIIAIRRG